MSEVIETYIRHHPDLGEKEAFDGFLRDDRIKGWVGVDESRRERLEKEFARIWANMRSAPVVGARAGPSGPMQLQQQRPLRVEVTPEAAPSASPSGRKLQSLCTRCGKLDVWMAGAEIACRTCGTHYDDMLQLIRVTPVGPFEFMFGGGWKGAATATGIGVGLIALYYLLRGL